MRCDNLPRLKVEWKKKAYPITYTHVPEVLNVHMNEIYKKLITIK